MSCGCFFGQVFEMKGSAFSIHEIPSPEYLNVSQTWLLFAAEGECCSVVQRHVYTIIPGELAVLGYLGRGDGDLAYYLCSNGGMRSWSNWCRIRQDRLTNTAVKFGNRRGRFDKSAWCPASKWPHLVHVKPATIACVTWMSSWCLQQREIPEWKPGWGSRVIQWPHSSALGWLALAVCAGARYSCLWW